MSVFNCSFIKSADKVYLKAKDHDFEGDEENAYIFFMRYFSIITLIKRNNKYMEKKVSEGLEKLGNRNSSPSGIIFSKSVEKVCATCTCIIML